MRIRNKYTVKKTGEDWLRRTRRTQRTIASMLTTQMFSIRMMAGAERLAPEKAEVFCAIGEEIQREARALADLADAHLKAGTLPTPEEWKTIAMETVRIGAKYRAAAEETGYLPAQEEVDEQ